MHVSFFFSSFSLPLSLSLSLSLFLSLALFLFHALVIHMGPSVPSTTRLSCVALILKFRHGRSFVR